MRALRTFLRLPGQLSKSGGGASRHVVVGRHREALETGRSSTHRVLEVEVLGVSGHWHPRQESQDVIVCLENRRGKMDSGPDVKMRREFRFSLPQRSEGTMWLTALLISSSFPKSHFPVFLVFSILLRPSNPKGWS